MLAASGTYAYGIEMKEVADLSKVGAIVTKGLSREPMAGNPAPRLVETESGMMNSVGLQNIGVKAFIAEKLPALRALQNARHRECFRLCGRGLHGGPAGP